MPLKHHTNRNLETSYFTAFISLCYLAYVTHNHNVHIWYVAIGRYIYGFDALSPINLNELCWFNSLRTRGTTSRQRIMFRVWQVTTRISGKLLFVGHQEQNPVKFLPVCPNDLTQQMYLEMLSAKRQPFCYHLNVLIISYCVELLISTRL